MTLLPLFVVRGIVIGPTLVLVGIACTALVLSRVLLGWSNVPPAAHRPFDIAEQREEPL